MRLTVKIIYNKNATLDNDTDKPLIVLMIQVKSSKPKSVQDDPTASEVYKKLFSSHKDAINQPVGNWVTFDPRYN